VIAVVSLLMVVALSLLLTRIATVALVHTGLSREVARFQARSAFTGVGFTTSETEAVVGHPVRRRIAMWLMLVGNAGFVTAVSALLLSFIDLRDREGAWIALGVMAGGLALLRVAAASRWVEQALGRAISWALMRWTNVDARDYARLLHLREDYGVTELLVGSDDWIAGRTLGEAGVVQEGLLVLGIECPGNHFLGAPDVDVEVRAGDRLILYGRIPRIAELDCRGVGEEGDRSHEAAMTERDRIAQHERSSAGR